jgi:hypothetical protein
MRMPNLLLAGEAADGEKSEVNVTVLDTSEHVKRSTEGNENI